MKKLIFCTGLPGSGKSYWATSQVPENGGGVIIVNKDDIRVYLTTTRPGWKWSHQNEKDVLAERDKQIVAALQHPDIHTVISTDTNFGKHEANLRQLAAENGAEFEINDSFLKVPIETCISRCQARNDGVDWASVIRGMAKANGLLLAPAGQAAAEMQNIVKVYVPDTSKPSAILCDLDGTLALLNGRNPYDASTCQDDLVNEPIRDIINAMYARYCKIIFMSGREDKYRAPTESFLTKINIADGLLLMRKSGDYRKDWIVKAELFDTYIRDNYHVRFVLDDRDQVVKMWRQMGLTCLQVNYGDF